MGELRIYTVGGMRETRHRALKQGLSKGDMGGGGSRFQNLEGHLERSWDFPQGSWSSTDPSLLLVPASCLLQGAPVAVQKMKR